MDKIIRRHPLQRLNSPSIGVSALVHVIGLANAAASFKYLVDNPSLANESYGWHFQYLTILGLLMATLTFTAGICADITASPTLFLAKNILSVCSAPMEVLISVLYWSICSYDRSLVVPEWAVLSLPADIGFHLIPSLILTIDLLFLSPPWTISALPAIGLSSCIAFGYWFWVELCHSHNGWYPYPLFDQLDTTGRVILFSGSAAVMTMNTVILKWLYGRINGFGTISPPKARPGAVKQ